MNTTQDTSNWHNLPADEVSRLAGTPGSWIGREAYVKDKGFALVSRCLIDSLKGYDILEVACGAGWLAHCLANAGCRIITTDAVEKRWGFKHGKWHKFIKSDASEAIKRYGKGKLVLASWLTDDNWTFGILDAIETGQKLCYIGEGHDGCCASNRWLDKLYAEFDRVEELPHAQWPGIHDTATIYIKKDAKGGRMSKTIK